MNDKMLQQITTDTDITDFQQQWDDEIIYSSLWNKENCATLSPATGYQVMVDTIILSLVPLFQIVNFLILIFSSGNS